jgi:hypothetical protein
MNAPFDHTKPPRVVALDGIWELDSTGHYQRVDIFEEETRLPLWQGLIPAMFGGLGLVALALWAVWRHLL